MIPKTRRLVLCMLLGLTLPAVAPTTAPAAPTKYRLDAKASQVGFRFTLAGAAQKGTMPISQSSIIVDPANLATSHVDVSVNVAAAHTPLGFATQAMIGPEVLDAARYPTIRFVSTTVQLAADGRLSDGARITGNLTMHGVTRPVTLNANLYRTRGSAADDLSALTVQLSGEVSRAAFGAVGYSDLVADTVGLDITAVINAVK